MRTLRKLLLSGLGTGYLPVAPGTWGSAAVAGLFLLIGSASPRAVCLNGSLAVLIVLSGVICVAFGRFAERVWRKKDPGRCVIDEWAGQAVALLFLPLADGPTGSAMGDMAVAVGAAFVAFREFDIIKPPPARQMEDLIDGWGVLMDDVVAGIYANVACQFVLRWAVGMV